VGIVLDTPTGRWCFSGDTHRTDRLYEVLNAGQRLDYLFIESAFADHERWLADISSHLCPELLFQELKKLTVFCEVWVSHLKPREHALIREELKRYSGARPLQVLSAGMVFNI
jgi:3',5'-cyclic-nucleotide phosphodiesterase